MGELGQAIFFWVVFARKMLSVQPEEVDADLLLSVESVLSSWLNMGQLATVFWCLSSLKLSKWLNFSFTNSRALLPTIHTNCPDWSHFAQNLTKGVSFCPEYHTQPLFFTQPAHNAARPFWGYRRTQNTPKPTPKHPSSWPDFESGQNEVQSAQLGPQLGTMFEKWAKLF